MKRCLKSHIQSNKCLLLDEKVMSHREFTHGEFIWHLLALVLLNISINKYNDKTANKLITFAHNTLHQVTKITLENRLKIQHKSDEQG